MSEKIVTVGDHGDQRKFRKYCLPALKFGLEEFIQVKEIKINEDGTETVLAKGLVSTNGKTFVSIDG